MEFQAITDNPCDKIDDVTDAVVGTEIEAAVQPGRGRVGQHRTARRHVRVQTEPLTSNEQIVVQDAIEGVTRGEVSTSSIGPTWGETVANRALIGLVVFMVFVVLFIWALLARVADVGRRASSRWPTTWSSPSGSTP